MYLLLISSLKYSPEVVEREYIAINKTHSRKGQSYPLLDQIGKQKGVGQIWVFPIERRLR